MGGHPRAVAPAGNADRARVDDVVLEHSRDLFLRDLSSVLTLGGGNGSFTVPGQVDSERRQSPRQVATAFIRQTLLAAWRPMEHQHHRIWTAWTRELQNANQLATRGVHDDFLNVGTQESLLV